METGGQNRCGPGFNSLIEIRRACSFSRTNAACNDSADGQIDGSTVDLRAEEGEQLYIVVSSHSLRPGEEISGFILSAGLIQN
jgi:hypothetical protein